MAKLTDELKDKILELHKKGCMYSEIARRTGLSIGTVSYAKRLVGIRAKEQSAHCSSMEDITIARTKSFIYNALKDIQDIQVGDNVALTYNMNYSKKREFTGIVTQKYDRKVMIRIGGRATMVTLNELVDRSVIVEKGETICGKSKTLKEEPLAYSP